MQRYVLGFLFDVPGNRVVLIRKNRPEWQAGRLNGVGGKVENNEGFYAAMQREFEEETGVTITDWRLFGKMSGPAWKVHLFTARSTWAVYAESMTDEKVMFTTVSRIKNGGYKEAISNIPWLVSMARDSLFNYNGPKSVDIKY